MKHIIPLLLTLVLTACGGGGGGSGTASSAASVRSTVLSTIRTNTVYTEAVGDLNGDGLDDVVVSGWNSDSATAYVYVFIQNSDGTLTDRTSLLPNNVIAGSQRVLIADFDSDGHMDIFIPGFGDGSAMTRQNSVMFWGSSGSYIRNDWTDNSMAHGACIGDINNDGRTDILIAGSGAWINNGGRAFTLNNIFTNNYFTACAVVKEATSSTVYLANNNSVAGYRDAIVVYDFSLTAISNTGYQSDNNYDTIDVVAADLTGDGNKDFVISLNGIAINATGPRQVLAYTGANTYSYSTTLGSGRSLYYAHRLTINGADSVFFSGDAQNASVYRGSTQYRSSMFSGNSFDPVNVYQNTSNGKMYMLQLTNGTFYTQEIQ